MIEDLTANFHVWERRGRGWQVWPYATTLEPPFRPFVGYAPRAPAPDDGHRVSLFERLLGLATAARSPAAEAQAEPEAVLAGSVRRSPLALRLTEIPRVEVDVAERFLLGLSGTVHPVAFEVSGTESGVNIGIVPADEDSGFVRTQTRGFFPSVGLAEQDALCRAWHEGGEERLVVEFGLAGEFMVPLRLPRGLEPDPLLPVYATLRGLRKGEVGALQLIFEAAQAPWPESILRAVSDGQGGSFFADLPELPELAREKVRHPLFAVVLRLAARAETEERSWEVVRSLASAFFQLRAPGLTELIPLTGSPEVDLEADLLSRSTHRSGMLLSSRELVTLVHVPTSALALPRVAAGGRKTKASPPEVRGDGVLLGLNRHAGVIREARLSPVSRLRHLHVLGASGTGKSTLFVRLALADIEAGAGIAVLDPHGDLVDDILARMPAARLSDTVVLDPAEEGGIGWNVLQAHSETEKTLLASDLVAVFRRLSTSWGDQMHAVLANAVQAILESTRGGTLADLRRFLVDKEYRDQYLTSVQDPEVVFYWREEFPLLAGKPQGSILTRLDSFLRPRPIRALVTRRENSLDLRGVMDRGQIFLARISQGTIGQENAALLGSMILSRLHQSALSRQELAPESRRPFFIYVDEFQHFVTPSLASLLQGGRKYGVGLLLAHQELEQIRAEDRQVLSALLANTETRIVFRVGDEDAKRLKDTFESFEAADLQTLKTGEAICRAGPRDHDFTLETAPLPPAEPESLASRRQALLARFASEREAIEPAVPAPLEPAALEPPLRIQVPVEALKTGEPVGYPPLGRGGADHRYVQELLKRWGEEKGFHATIEKPLPAGGRVDVFLEREGARVACEISVSTSADHEMANLRKCLTGDADYVVLTALDGKRLSALREAVSHGLSEADRERVAVLAPEEVFDYLGWLPSGGAETRIGGYRVKVTYGAGSAPEQGARKRAIGEVIARSIRRLKGR